jgi:hypothetical protein
MVYKNRNVVNMVNTLNIQWSFSGCRGINVRAVGDKKGIGNGKYT